jgi:hypothetical protein
VIRFLRNNSAIATPERGRHLRSAVVMVVSVASLLLTAAPAVAVNAHVLSTTFGAASSIPANPYPLSNPADAAVDNSAGSSVHDVYVVDPANFRVEKFDSLGNFIFMFGQHVNQTTGGDVCTVASGDTCQAGTSGSTPGSFITPTFVAADGSSGPSAGDVYVGDSGDNLVSKFGPSGNLIASWGSGGQLDGSTATDGPFNGMAGIAVDSAGTLYVYNGGTLFKFGQDGSFTSDFGLPFGTTPVGIAIDSSGNIYKVRGSDQVAKLNSSGSVINEGFSGGVASIAIDPSNDDLYVDEDGGFISRFTCGSSCTPTETFGEGNLNGAQGIGVDASTHTVYAADAGAGNVAVFGYVALPDVTTGQITNPRKTSVTLTGHIDPAGAGPITACHFDYGTDTSYGKTAPCAEGNSFSAAAGVHADVSGLTTEATYHFRLVATNAAGASRGHDQSFETLGAHVSHTLTTDFGTASSTPANPYPLLNPSDVEVDQTSHDIYVTDPGNYRVEKFSEEGKFLLMFGKEVNKTAVEDHRISEENVCPTSGHSGDECQPGVSGESPGAFETPSYLAVDNSCFQHQPPLTAATTPTCEEFDPSSGDLYVADTGDNLVSKFDASGRIVTNWGVSGQKDGSDADFGPFATAGPIFGVAVGGPNGNLFVGGNAGVYNNFWEYSQSGTPIGPYHNSGAPWLKVDPAGNVYAGAPYALDLPAEELYQDTGSVIYHYGTLAGGEPVDRFGGGQLSGPMGIAVDGTSHTVYVANSTIDDVGVFGDVRPIVTTGPPTEVTESEVTLTGHIDPAGRGNVTSCQFEYGLGRSYGTTVPCTPDPTGHAFEGPTDVTAIVSGFSPGTKDHYRLVATNADGGTANGLDETFITTQPPAIDGLKAEELTATSAELVAKINPNGLDTTYQVKYGPSTNYGQATPEGSIKAANSDQPIKVDLTNLAPGVEYHYTLIATNADGTTTAVDHTFNFYPPSCPNENVRQQTETNYLPDCRAYELVSPENAGGTQLYPGGPNTGYATNPSRLSFVGLFSTIPNSGGSPIDGIGDLYVSTRTDTGWVTRYVGLPSAEVAVDGGPPMGPPVSAGVVGTGLTSVDNQIGLTNESNGERSNQDKIQNNVLTDPAMNKFVDWNDGGLDREQGGGSNAGYVWSAHGNFLDRWPTNLATVPAGNYPNGPAYYFSNPEFGPPFEVAPGGANALHCPTVAEGGFAINDCPGDVTASSDLSHFVFATEWNSFAPGGLVSSPGSVYDNNTGTDTVDIASKLAGGAPIPAEPTDEARDPLQIPAVSADGSHILMAAGVTGPCGSAQCPESTHCQSTFQGVVARCQMQPSQLYMRVDDAATYEIAPGHAVTYDGMTPDGSKVYFTTEEHLTNEDLDHGGTSLYMWSEKGEKEEHPLTLISKGNNPGKEGEPGNTAACSASFTSKCGIVTYSDVSYCTLYGGAGGNCHSDNSIAAENGNVYFFSPEQLDGSRGIPNQENLYDYRNGAVQYVTTFTTGPFCYPSRLSACSDTPIARMQVNPDDSHMAFLTASPITQYDNAGHLEMYTYEPSTGKIICVSCNPSGTPPTSDVQASQDGLFMASDGRTFFSTDEALVLGDTNQGQDVYEYVDGRPQLITPGTGDSGTQESEEANLLSPPGLIGVSANGLDVYFSTVETLVPQDHNGLFIKFYDARAGGGLSAPPPPPSCDAAEECHGTGTELPAASKNGTAVALGADGNFPARKPGVHRKRHRRSHKRHHTRAAKHSRGGM